ncbi:MAG: 1-acyl-sn-glycerol-3-phosphate acyltransferase [Erythrobacter sp.]|nr:1-acyl-sn-glycerol-3-phosphate acyltransferase [Erythrobacter sp.]NNC48501.1 1-acyl-sn-glycerol-3-phosphate acyltransferase [Sphingomonas sp.]
MAFLRSMVFVLLFYPGTLIYCLIGLLLVPFGQKPLRGIVHAWADYHYYLVKYVLRIEMKWEGEIPEGAYLIAVKHEAMVETVETLRFARTPIVVMKRELSHMPIFGWVTQAYGVIGVDRNAGARALREMMKRGQKAVRENRPIVIFPEGTRVPVGERPRLRPGFVGMYRVLKLPVVPVAVDSGTIWPRGFVKKSGSFTFKVGDIIPPGLPREEMERQVHAAINALNVPRVED